MGRKKWANDSSVPDGTGYLHHITSTHITYLTAQSILDLYIQWAQIYIYHQNLSQIFLGIDDTLR